MDTRVVTAHLPLDLADKLDGLAQRLDRPKGWIPEIDAERHRWNPRWLFDAIPQWLMPPYPSAFVTSSTHSS